MRIRLSISTIWTVHPNDIELAHELLTKQHYDMVAECIDAAFHADQEFSEPTVEVIEVTTESNDKHNEITAMYREVLKAIGMSEDNFTTLTPEGVFWDKRIYVFANTWKDHPTRRMHLILLHDVIAALQELWRQKYE